METEDFVRPNPQELTPGPWKWEFIGNAGNYFLVGNGGKGSVTFSGPGSADGRLMQAAPALLAALKKIVAGNPGGPQGWLTDIQMADIARAAIAAVEGE